MLRIMVVLPGDRRLVVLGLDQTNLDRLKADEPIRVNLRNLDPDGPPTDLPDIDIAILWAPDPDKTVREIKGLIE